MAFSIFGAFCLWPASAKVCLWRAHTQKEILLSGKKIDVCLLVVIKVQNLYHSSVAGRSNLMCFRVFSKFAIQMCMKSSENCVRDLIFDQYCRLHVRSILKVAFTMIGLELRHQRICEFFFLISSSNFTTFQFDSAEGSLAISMGRQIMFHCELYNRMVALLGIFFT